MSVQVAPRLHPGTNPTTNRHGPVAPALAVTAVSTANRQAMPKIAAVVDRLRAVFGPVQVIFASEGEKNLGREPPPGVIAHPLHAPCQSRGNRPDGGSTLPARTSHRVTTMVKR